MDPGKRLNFVLVGSYLAPAGGRPGKHREKYLLWKKVVQTAFFAEFEREE